MLARSAPDGKLTLAKGLNAILMDHLLSGNLAACGDALLQRFKAVELAGEAGWAVASRMELIPQSAVSAVPSEEREAALTLEGRERKLLGFADGLRKGKS